MAETTSQPSKPTVDAFTSFVLAPFKMFGTTATSTTSVVAAYRQTGLEIADLAAKRSRALTDAATKTRQCKNTGELANVTFEFWSTVWSQQIESANRIAALFGNPHPLALMVNKPSVARDVLTVPDAATETGKPTTKTEWADQSNRRAA